MSLSNCFSWNGETCAKLAPFQHMNDTSAPYSANLHSHLSGSNSISFNLTAICHYYSLLSFTLIIVIITILFIIFITATIIIKLAFLTVCLNSKRQNSVSAESLVQLFTEGGFFKLFQNQLVY